MTSSSGQIVIGGEHDEKKCYIAPTVIDNVSQSDPIMQEEIFGPLLPILSCPDFGNVQPPSLHLVLTIIQDSAIEFINQREKPLSAYCFATDKKETQERLSAITMYNFGNLLLS